MKWSEHMKCALPALEHWKGFTGIVECIRTSTKLNWLKDQSDVFVRWWFSLTLWTVKIFSTSHLRFLFKRDFIERSLVLSLVPADLTWPAHKKLRLQGKVKKRIHMSYIEDSLSLLILFQFHISIYSFTYILSHRWIRVRYFLSVLDLRWFCIVWITTKK